jgi:hypothetical protein
MDEFSTTSDTLDQADEDILTYTASDEALEAAAGIENPFINTTPWGWTNNGDWQPACCGGWK